MSKLNDLDTSVKAGSGAVGGKSSSKRNEKAIEAPIPIPFVRSSLFSIATSGDAHVEKVVLDVDKGPLGIHVLYKGPHLNQEHSKLFQALLFIARQRNVLDGSEFHVYAQDLMRHMGKRYRDQDQRDNIWNWLGDLKDASLELCTKSSDYKGSLLMSIERNKTTGLCALRIDPKLAKLLQNETLENDMGRVASLGRDYLAIWLHNYFASWGTFRNIPISEIYKLCGSKTKELRQFKYQLKMAMTKISELEGSFIEEFSISSDNIIYVSKKKTHVRLLRPEQAVQLTPGNTQRHRRSPNANRGKVVL